MIRLSLMISANSRNGVAPPEGVTVACARVVGGVGGGGGGGVPGGSQSTLPGPPAPSHFQVEPAGSMIMLPNRPTMFWKGRSVGNRLSAPNSTGVWTSAFVVWSRSTLPAYHLYVTVW